MSESQYRKYILTGKAEEGPGLGTTPVVSAALEGLEDWGGIRHRISWKYISGPTMMIDEPHLHDFDEFLVFLGNNPADPKDFNAEIEFSFGVERETHKIDSAAVVCVPRGIVHCPLNFKKIGRPILFSVVYLAPDYERKSLSDSYFSSAASVEPDYGKYILVEPKGEGPRKLDTEEWGVSINEDITSAVGKFNCNFNFLGILGPHVLPDPPHSHNCDEFLFLIPASHDDWPSLGGEVEIAIGEDWEKQSINTAAVICMPIGVQHCPVYMKRVDKPFYWGHILLAPSYGSSAYDPEQSSS